MRKIPFLKPVLFTFLLFSAFTIQAQTQYAVASLSPSKELPIEIGGNAANAGLKRTPVTTFQSAFPDATEVSWSNTNGISYVFFKTPNKMNRVFFNKKGKISYTISYYSKELLPTSILKQVKNIYSDKTIFGVTEIGCDNQTAYQIVLEDETSWTNITIVDNEIQDEQVWVKASR